MSQIHDTSLDERVLDATVGALEMYSIHLGRRLGLYEALTTPRTVATLAAASGVTERYVREWSEQQAVAGLIEVDDPSAPWDARNYRLSDDQRSLFVDPDDLTHVSPLADMIAGIGGVLDAVADAYRDGGGVAYAEYGDRFRFGQGRINRPAFTNELAQVWFADVPEVVQRLHDGGRIADIGCGTGWSTIALAKAFPAAEVIGYDADAASIADAEQNARHEGVTVKLHAADASTVSSDGPFDLILVAETLHDLADPVGALSVARAALVPGGAVVVADENVAEEFTAPGDLLERMMYGWSVVHCLPASLAEDGSAGIGTVLRPSLVRLLAEEAGFTSFHHSDVDAGFFNIYVLRS